MVVILLMDKILHDPKDSKLWELWYIPYNGECRILSINSSSYNCTPFLHSLLTKGKKLEAGFWLRKLVGANDCIPMPQQNLWNP